MANDIQFRRPRIGPYISRFRNHWAWNAKSLLTPRQALHDRVQGKVVLLTGASSGIGEGVAEKLADAGATLLLVARNAEKLEAIASKIKKRGGKACIYPGDLTDLEECDRICQQALADHGRVDILINNAGRSIRRSIKFTVNRFHDYERTMQLNYFAALRLAVNLLPGMEARDEGHIINVSTVGVQANPARFSAYLGSKWALEGWTWVAANEYAHTNLRFSSINYPLVRTPMIAPTKIYDYLPVMSPETAVNWLLDVVITQNKRKLGIFGKGALAMYYLLPKTSESIVNLSYQSLFETPPADYVSRKDRFVGDDGIADRDNDRKVAPFRARENKHRA
ncbi:SDR family NAD(P)-dependent oxidoreductase [Alcanivorax sp. IL3]|uniref:SDR family NAD(P)-dependent oxidoreductase n=1 Tax=unclassified Alcanivorax TaxID=2638842 RepID=UPI0039C19A07